MDAVDALDGIWEHAEDYESLCDAIKEGHKYVAYCYGDLTETEAAQLVSVLSLASSLEGLYFWEVPLNDQIVKCLVAGLKDSSSLETLILRESHVSSQGAKLISELVKTNGSIQSLFLLGNMIDDKGVSSLATSLKMNSSVVRLDLRRNPIGLRGMEQVLRALDINQNVCSIEFSWKGIKESEKLKHMMKKKIGRNRKIAKLRSKCEQYLKFGASVKAMTSKLVLIGPMKSGKTSVLNSLVGKYQDATQETYVPTTSVGIANLVTKPTTASEIEYQNLNRNKVQALLGSSGAASESDVWEHAGVPEEDICSQMLIRAARKNALETVESNLQRAVTQKRLQKESTGDDSQDVSKLSTYEDIDDNGTDIHLPQIVPNEEISTIIRDPEILQKSKDDHRYALTVWDLGGNALSMSFFSQICTRSSVYLYVFDMRKALNEKSVFVDVASQWLSSVKLLANGDPSVLLVGTHVDAFDQSSSSIAETDKMIKPLIKQFPKIVKNSGKHLSFFPTDNITGGGVGQIRLKVEAEMSKLPWVQKLSSLRWYRCLDQLLKIKAKNVESWFVDSGMVTSTAKSLGMEKQETETMLEFFSEMGLIMYSRHNPAFKGNIIRNPKKFFGTLKTLEAFSRGRKAADIFVQENDLKMLRENSMASRHLLETLWTLSSFDFATELLQENLYMGSFHVLEKPFFTIPSFAKPERIADELISNRDVPYCILDLSKSCFPTGIFQRIACALVMFSGRMANSEPPKFWRTSAKIWLGPDDTVELELSFNRLLIFSSNAERASAVVLTVLYLVGYINKANAFGRMSWNVEFQGVREERKKSSERPPSLMRTGSLRFMLNVKRRQSRQASAVSFMTALTKELDPWFSNPVLTDNSIVKDSSNVDDLVQGFTAANDFGIASLVESLLDSTMTTEV